MTATEAQIVQAHAKIERIHLMLREAWLQQGKHSGVVHAELSAMLVAIETLTEIVTVLADPPQGAVERVERGETY